MDTHNSGEFDVGGLCLMTLQLLSSEDWIGLRQRRKPEQSAQVFYKRR
jgi:hypothetical protein